MASNKNKELRDYLIPGLKGLGTGLRVGSSIAAGIESREVGQFNIKQLDREASNLGLSKGITLKQMDRAAKRLEGQQQTTIATSGLAVSGSLVDLMADTAAQLKLEKSMQAERFEQQRQSLEAEKQLTKRETAAAERGAYFSAATKLGEGLYSLLK